MKKLFQIIAGLLCCGLLFTATATSGLPIEYEFADNKIISVYDVNG